VSNPTRATEATLGALHGLIADTLMGEINGYRERGEAVPPALLAQAIKLLKDNGIDAPAMSGSKIDRLAKALPDLDELDNVVSFSR